MAYQLPDGTLIRAPRRGRSFIIDGVRHPEIALNYWRDSGSLERWGVTIVPDPQPAPPTQEQLDERARQQRQRNRITTLQNAVIDQFDMIMALFQVGRAKGVWAATDFPEGLRTKVTEWRALIDDYRAEDIDEDPLA